MHLSKSKFQIYSSLGNPKMRKKYSLFTVEGEKAVRDSLDSYQVEAVVIVEGKTFDFIPKDILVFEVDESEMKKISNFATPSGIIAVFRLPEESGSELMCTPTKLYLVLDGVRDPGNFGTIVRTCHWFGIDTIFASFDSVDIYNPKTLQATMGSFTKVKVCYCDLFQLLKNNKQMPFYGLMLDGDNIYNAELTNAGFIIMGNEGKGISSQLRTLVTKRLLIPPGTTDHSESLNVAVATAVTLSQFASRHYNNNISNL